MKSTRRSFLKAATLAGVGLAVARHDTNAADGKPVNFITKEPRMKLGTVTYNLAQDWDVPTIIKNCTEAKFQGVELRTSHAHMVEVALRACAT